MYRNYTVYLYKSPQLTEGGNALSRNPSLLCAYRHMFAVCDKDHTS